MAARKLKFKPKPVVGGAVRRQREKEEIPVLTSNEPSVKQESAHETTSYNSIKIDEAPIANQPMFNEENISKRMRIEQTESIKIDCTENTVKPCNLAFSSVSSPNVESTATTILNITDNETTKQPSDQYTNEVDLSDQKYPNLSQNSGIGSDAALCSQNSTLDNFSSEPNSFVNSEIDSQQSSSLSQASTSSVKSVEKLESTKGLSRFGRSKFKPVLGNNITRKKTESSVSTGNSKSDNPEIDTVTAVRTESVIKCTSSKTSLPSIVSEITDSFSTLESDGSNSAPLSPQQMKESEVSPKLSRFNFDNDEITGVNELESCSNDYLGNTKNVVKPTTSNVVSCSTTNQTHSSQLSRVLENVHNSFSSSSSVLTSSPSKVPISPLKLSSKILAPKPCPNLLDTTVRRISFQSSDSEEECKRKNSKSTVDKISKKVKVEKEVKSRSIEPISSRKKEDKFEVTSVVKEALAEQAVDDVDEEPPAPAVPVPQLKVGPDGQIMLDPKSLVIETTEVKEKRAEMEKSEVIRETGITRYNTYSKKKHTRRDWNARETVQFYKALSTIGSDFTLMTKLFPRRSRHELKLKFKKEEKTNLKLVDKAMTAPGDFDFNSLEEEMRRENEEIAKQKEEKRLAAEAARKERAERKEKQKFKRKYPKEMKTAFAAFKNFDEAEVESMCVRNKPSKARREKKKRVVKKRPSDVLISSSSDEEDIVVIDYDSDKESCRSANLDENERSLLTLIRQKARGGRTRKARKVKKLEEYDEINETLKRKLEEIDSDASDGYTPNGLGADVLFGSPQRDPFPDAPADQDGSQWSMEVNAAASVESVVLVCDRDNYTSTNDLSKIRLLGENQTDLDPALPVTETQEVSRRSESTNSILNKHLISESIQIIDQLTSSEHINNEQAISDKSSDEKEVSSHQEPSGNQIAVRNLESVGRSCHTEVSTLQDQNDGAHLNENRAEICKNENRSVISGEFNEQVGNKKDADQQEPAL